MCNKIIIRWSRVVNNNKVLVYNNERIKIYDTSFKPKEKKLDMISNMDVFQPKEDIWMFHIFLEDILEEIDVRVES
jgi:hypothetical protein